MSNIQSNQINSNNSNNIVNPIQTINNNNSSLIDSNGNIGMNSNLNAISQQEGNYSNCSNPSTPNSAIPIIKNGEQVNNSNKQIQVNTAINSEIKSHTSPFTQTFYTSSTNSSINSASSLMNNGFSSSSQPSSAGIISNVSTPGTPNSAIPMVKSYEQINSQNNQIRVNTNINGMMKPPLTPLAKEIYPSSNNSSPNSTTSLINNNSISSSSQLSSAGSNFVSSPFGKNITPIPPNMMYNRPPPNFINFRPAIPNMPQNPNLQNNPNMPMGPNPSVRPFPPPNRPILLPIRPFVPTNNPIASPLSKNSVSTNGILSPLEMNQIQMNSSKQNTIKPINTNNLTPSSQDNSNGNFNSSQASYSSTNTVPPTGTTLTNQNINSPIKNNITPIYTTPKNQLSNDQSSPNSKNDLPALNISALNHINLKFPPPYSSSPIAPKKINTPLVHNNLQAQLNREPLERSQSCTPSPINTTMNQLKNLNISPQPNVSSEFKVNTFATVYTSSPIFSKNTLTTSQQQITSNQTNSKIMTPNSTINPNNNIPKNQPIPIYPNSGMPKSPLSMVNNQNNNNNISMLGPPNAISKTPFIGQNDNNSNIFYSNSMLFYRENDIDDFGEGKSLSESKSMTLINDFKPITRNTSNYIIPGDEDSTTISNKKNEIVPSGIFYCSPSAMPIYETESLTFYSKSKMPKFTNLFNEKHNISQFDYHILPKSPKDTVIRSYNSIYSYVSSSLNVIPYSKSILKKLNIPFSIIFSPYRNLHEGDARIPVVNPEKIAMCTNCRAYINPFVTFIDDNSRYRCNICNQINALPSFYKWSGKKGMKRPELVNPVVDYVFPIAPEDITSTVYLFVIDVSYISIQSGMVYTIANTILNSLDKIPNHNDKASIGFITVDSTVHYYKFDSKEESPSMIVMSELEDVFLPSPKDLFVNIKEYRKAIEEFLKKLNKIFSFTYVNSNVMGSALKGAFEMIKEIGGKILVFQSLLPDAGQGALKAKNLEEEKENTIFQPSDKFYSQFAKECGQNKICIDLFLFPHQYMDIASLSILGKNTGGSVYIYENFNSSIKEDENKLNNELIQVLSKSVGHDAFAYFNLSKGLTISKVHGNITSLTYERYLIPILNPENSYTLEIEVSDNIKDTNVSIQLVLVHINDKGERKVRIITQSFPTSSNLTSIIENIDICTLCTFLAKKAVDNTINYGAEYARNQVEETCFNLVKSLHNIFFSKEENKLLKIPSTVKLLPLFSLALLNNEGIRNSKNISIDRKIYILSQIYSKSVNGVMNMIIPRFYCLHNLSSRVGQPIEDIKGSVGFPNAQNLCSDRIEGSGLYLIDNGLDLYIWIGKNCEMDTLQSLFNKNYDAILSGKMELPELQNEFSMTIHKLIAKIRSHHLLSHNCYPALYIVKETSQKILKRSFFANLIEDRHEYAPSYPQYLNNLLNKLRNKTD